MGLRLGTLLSNRPLRNQHRDSVDERVLASAIRAPYLRTGSGKDQSSITDRAGQKLQHAGIEFEWLHGVRLLLGIRPGERSY